MWAELDVVTDARARGLVARGVGKGSRIRADSVCHRCGRMVPDPSGSRHTGSG